MDEEGFPRLAEMRDANANPFPELRPIRRRRISEDKESGETTNHQVMIIRRPQVMQGKNSLSHTRRKESDFQKALELHWSILALTHTMPDFKFHHATCPKDKCAASSSTQRTANDKESFRIPQSMFHQSEPKIRPKREVIVSVWKECIYGDRLFDVSAAELASARQQSCLLAFLTECLGKFIPCICIKLVAILLIALRCVLCQANMSFVYVYRSRQHEKIHLKCEEKGLKPVFTGPAFHGPLIWSVRHFSCQYCRAQKQSDIILKLLEIMNQERRNELR